MTARINLTGNWQIEQGADYTLQLTWKPGGVLADLTGYTARMQIRTTRTASSFLLELTTANGRIELGGAAGTVTLSITAADTTSITWRRGVYDLELVSSTGVVTRLAQGEVSCSLEVTR